MNRRIKALTLLRGLAGIVLFSADPFLTGSCYAVSPTVSLQSLDLEGAHKIIEDIRAVNKFVKSGAQSSTCPVPPIIKLFASKKQCESNEGIKFRDTLNVLITDLTKEDYKKSNLINEQSSKTPARGDRQAPLPKESKIKQVLQIVIGARNYIENFAKGQPPQEVMTHVLDQDSLCSIVRQSLACLGKMELKSASDIERQCPTAEKCLASNGESAPAASLPLALECERDSKQEAFNLDQTPEQRNGTYFETLASYEILKSPGAAGDALDKNALRLSNVITQIMKSEDGPLKKKIESDIFGSLKPEDKGGDQLGRCLTLSGTEYFDASGRPSEKAQKWLKHILEDKSDNEDDKKYNYLTKVKAIAAFGSLIQQTGAGEKSNPAMVKEISKMIHGNEGLVAERVQEIRNEVRHHQFDDVSTRARIERPILYEVCATGNIGYIFA